MRDSSIAKQKKQRHSYVTIDGVKVAYRKYDNGKDKNVFLVHGWGGSLASLDKLAGQLNEIANTYLIDLPGFGNSANPPKEWGPIEYANLVGDWINTFKTKQNYYIGHSFGGGIGVYLSATDNELLEKLILTGAAIYRNPKTAKSVEILQGLPFYDLIKNSLKNSKRLVYKMLFRNSDSYKFSELELNFRKIISTDLSKFLSNINIPTLLLWGEDDKDTPVSHAYRLQKDISGSTLIVYPGYSHGLAKLNPDVISDDIIKFILKNK